MDSAERPVRWPADGTATVPRLVGHHALAHDVVEVLVCLASTDRAGLGLRTLRPDPTGGPASVLGGTRWDRDVPPRCASAATQVEDFLGSFGVTAGQVPARRHHPRPHPDREAGPTRRGHLHNRRAVDLDRLTAQLSPAWCPDQDLGSLLRYVVHTANFAP